MRGQLKYTVSDVFANFRCSRLAGRSAHKIGCGLAEWTFLNRPEAAVLQRLPVGMGPFVFSLFNTHMRDSLGASSGCNREVS